MLTQVLHVNFSSLTVPHLISVVQGDTGRNLKCIVDDFTLDGAWAATWYVERPSDVPVYNTATIETSDNSVNLELTAQSINEVGDNKLQVRILDADEQVVTSFACILSVKPFGGIDAVESTTESNIFDQQVEEAKQEIDTALDEHLENGIFPSMTAGGLAGDSYAENKVPYFFRPSGGGAEVGTIEAPVLVGGSVGWNQLMPEYSAPSTSNGITTARSGGHYTATGTPSATWATVASTYSGYLIENHVYIMCLALEKNTSSITFSLSTLGGGTVNPSFNLTNINAIGNYSRVVKSNLTSTVGINFGFNALTSGTSIGTIEFDFWFIDLTLLLGSTIADRLYTLEQSTAGSGIAQLKAWGFDFDEYIPYTAPTLKHVEGVSAHVMRDANDNIIGNYPLDATLTLRGVPKLDANNQLYYDGDTYAPDGTVTRNCAIRAYQSGDESLADAITDGTNTVYKLSTPTTETATPYTEYQSVDASGTEEYVSTGVVPVGHVTKYPTDLKGTLETILSAIPSGNGTYALNVTVANGKHTFSWV